MRVSGTAQLPVTPHVDSRVMKATPRRRQSAGDMRMSDVFYCKELCLKRASFSSQHQVALSVRSIEMYSLGRPVLDGLV